MSLREVFLDIKKAFKKKRRCLTWPFEQTADSSRIPIMPALCPRRLNASYYWIYTKRLL